MVRETTAEQIERFEEQIELHVGKDDAFFHPWKRIDSEGLGHKRKPRNVSFEVSSEVAPRAGLPARPTASSGGGNLQLPK